MSAKKKSLKKKHAAAAPKTTVKPRPPSFLGTALVTFFFLNLFLLIWVVWMLSSMSRTLSVHEQQLMLLNASLGSSPTQSAQNDGGTQTLGTTGVFAKIQELSKTSCHESQKTSVKVFVDPYCSYCYAMIRAIDSVKESLGDKLKLEYVFFPLEEPIVSRTLHPGAYNESLRFVCAQRLGAFDEYKDCVLPKYFSQKQVKEYSECITEAGIDPVSFKSCFENQAPAVLAQHIDLAKNQYGVTATPSMVFDCNYFKRGTVSAADFTQVVETLAAS